MEGMAEQVSRRYHLSTERVGASSVWDCGEFQREGAVTEKAPSPQLRRSWECVRALHNWT